MCVKEVKKHAVPVFILVLIRYFYPFLRSVLRIQIWDPVLFDLWIRIRDLGWKKSGPGIMFLRA
jgi:hypothetical protein